MMNDAEKKVGPGGKFLFFIILTLVVLTQVEVFHWSVEAILFGTWFFLVLTIRHESRFSAAIGLIFLVSCPFFLISRKEILAEQAANFAYLFLAIGVLVQLEEMLLERYGWLNCKLDFSHQWQMAVQGLGRQLARVDRPERVRLVQMIGTFTLIGAFLALVSLKGQFIVALWLLGSAVVFPFLVWGIRLAVRALGPDWLLRGICVLVVFPLVVVGVVRLYDQLEANQLARMKVSYVFIDHLGEALYPIPLGEGETAVEQDWTIDQVTQRVLYQPPAFAGSSRILYQVQLDPQSKLAFDVATDPASWNLEGDGVAFTVYIVADGITYQIFSTYIDPKHNLADQRWDPYTIDLSVYSGKPVTLIFETNVGPVGDFRNDWAGWGNPRLLVP
jgi:hypothetical protein